MANSNCSRRTRKCLHIAASGNSNEGACQTDGAACKVGLSLEANRPSFWEPILVFVFLGTMGSLLELL